MMYLKIAKEFCIEEQNIIPIYIKKIIYNTYNTKYNVLQYI